MGGHELEGKIALVTGGGTGIGRAVALAYADRGAKVWICGRRRAPLEDTVAQIRRANGEADLEMADVRSLASLERLRGIIERASGRLDVLVNNAAILGPVGSLAATDPKGWDEVVRVNLTGAFLAARAFVPLLARSKAGSIINVTSGLGRRCGARFGPYSVSKFGIEGLTQALAADLGPLGIRVNAVNPGEARTDLRAAAFPEEDPAALPGPETVTRLFVYLASDASREISGESLDSV